MPQMTTWSCRKVSVKPVPLCGQASLAADSISGLLLASRGSSCANKLDEGQRRVRTIGAPPGTPESDCDCLPGAKAAALILPPKSCTS